MKNQKNSIKMSLKKVYERMAGRAIIALLPIFIFAIIQLVRFGNQKDYVLLLVGSILSVAGIMGYIIAELRWSVKKQKSWIAMLLIFSGFIPYLFGSYLVFIRGFWSLRELAGGFSFLIIIEVLIFIILGYEVVSKLYKITEIGKRIRKDIH